MLDAPIRFNRIQLASPQTLPLLQTPTIHFSASVDKVSVKKGSQRTSLFDYTESQKSYAEFLERLLAPYGLRQVLRWDRLALPPVEMLKTFTDSGKFVVGVPLPNPEDARPMLNNPTILKYLGEEKQKQMTALLADANYRHKTLPELEQLGKDGHAKALVMNSLSLVNKASVGVCTFLGVSTGLAAETISKIGTPAQQAFWLHALNKGVATYAFGLTEKKVGSNPRGIQTTFKKEIGPEGETVYSLTGNKKFIGNAARVERNGKLLHGGADFIQIFAVDDPKKAPEERSFRVFMVPRVLLEEKIKHTGGKYNKTGLREVNNGDFKFKNIKVPEAFMLGKPDEDIYPKLLGVLDETRLFVASQGLGIADVVNKAAIDFAKKRNQNGQIIDNFPTVGFPLRDFKAKALAGRLLLMDAANMVDNAAAQRAKGEKPTSFRTETSMAKLYNTELAEDSAKQAKNTFGGRGYLEKYGIGKRIRDSLVLTVYEGTSNVQRNVIFAGVAIVEGKKLANKVKKTIFGAFSLPGVREAAIVAKLMTRWSPTARIEAGYRYALADVLPRFNKEDQRLKKEWKEKGVPADYRGWDEDSLLRQRKMDASIPIQARTHLLADIATQRKLAQLAKQHLSHLSRKENLSPEEKDQKKSLKRFMNIASQEVLILVVKLASRHLKDSEKEYREEHPARS